MFTVPSRRAATFVVAALALCVTLALAASAFAYTISGSVVDSATGTPINDAELQLWKWSAASQSWTRPGIYGGTGVTGAYTINFDGDGLYILQCYNVDDYAVQWWNLSATEASAATLTVPGSTLTDINFRLVPPKPTPELTLIAPSPCSYASVKLSGYLKLGDVPLANKKIVIVSYPNAIRETLGYDMTDVNGYYTFTAKPKTVMDCQAIFEGDAEYGSHDTAIATVLPKVSLTKPAGPSSAKTSTTFTSYSYLKPRHTAGTKPIYIACQRKESGKWVTKKSVLATAKNATLHGVQASKCSAKIRLTKKGSWRIVAVHAKDSLNAKTLSSKRYITVK
jgi:hypothetical protein